MVTVSSSGLRAVVGGDADFQYGHLDARCRCWLADDDAGSLAGDRHAGAGGDDRADLPFRAVCRCTGRPGRPAAVPAPRQSGSRRHRRRNGGADRGRSDDAGAAPGLHLRDRHRSRADGSGLASGGAEPRAARKPATRDRAELDGHQHSARHRPGARRIPDLGSGAVGPVRRQRRELSRHHRCALAVEAGGRPGEDPAAGAAVRRDGNRVAARQPQPRAQGDTGPLVRFLHLRQRLLGASAARCPRVKAAEPKSTACCSPRSAAGR